MLNQLRLRVVRVAKVLADTHQFDAPRTRSVNNPNR